MRILFIVLLSLSFIAASAQKCMFEMNSTDEFTGKINILTSNQTLFYLNNDNNLTCNLKYSDGHYYIIFKFNKEFPTGVRIIEQNILFKATNDSIIRMCLTSSDLYLGYLFHELDNIDVSYLKTFDISIIRIETYTNGHRDFKLAKSLNGIPNKYIKGQQNINPQQYFKNSLRCIENELHSK